MAERKTVAGIEVNSVSLREIFRGRGMLTVYLLLAIAAYGVYHVFLERYFIPSATAWDAGMHPGSAQVAAAMKHAVFGSGGEVHREAPWSLYIVNYMYMIYVGSGIIFLVALAELFDIKLIVKTASGFLVLGLGMILAGLFTIMADLNILHIYHMFLSPRFGSGMWLMMPLYSIYIPLVMLEIYLILSHRDSWIKRVAFLILIVSFLVEFVEFYIQAKLFDMNSARHLWTTYPLLTLYFMVSSFTASVAVMTVYTYFAFRKSDRSRCTRLLVMLQRIALYSVMALGAYEATAYLFIDKNWAAIILFGEFKYWFYSYLILAVGLPFLLLIKTGVNSFFKVLAALSIIVGTYLGRIIFVYGGNAYPMSDRFGTGFEKYSIYEKAKDIVFYPPSIYEIAVVVGSLGIVLLVFRILDKLFDISVIREV